MNAKALILIVVAMVLVSIPVAANEIGWWQQQAGVEHVETDCLFGLPDDEVDGKTIVCGELLVPENWEDPDSETVTISYAVLKSPSLSPFADHGFQWIDRCRDARGVGSSGR